MQSLDIPLHVPACEGYSLCSLIIYELLYTLLYFTVAKQLAVSDPAGEGGDHKQVLRHMHCAHHCKHHPATRYARRHKPHKVLDHAVTRYARHHKPHKVLDHAVTMYARHHKPQKTNLEATYSSDQPITDRDQYTTPVTTLAISHLTFKLM